jgi:hypothetical protein
MLDLLFINALSDELFLFRDRHLKRMSGVIGEHLRVRRVVGDAGPGESFIARRGWIAFCDLALASPRAEGKAA